MLNGRLHRRVTAGWLMPVSAAEDCARRCYVVTDQMTYAVASTLTSASLASIENGVGGIEAYNGQRDM